jgi:glycerol-3-phosphate acyltransferase PlsY
LVLLITVLAAYLLGSVSFAVMVSHAYRLPDPREYGSGNPGATNVLRSGRKSAAVLTLLGDSAKGWVAVFCAQQWNADGRELAMALAAVAGAELDPRGGYADNLDHHCRFFPVFIAGRTGVGVVRGIFRVDPV